MALPVMQEVSGQGGHVRVGTRTFLVKNWMIRKSYHNADATNSGCGGWRKVVRVLGMWDFTFTMAWDAANASDYVAPQTVNGIYPPSGIDQGVTMMCYFQLGASGLQYQGWGVVNSVSPFSDAEDLVHYSVQGDGNGALLGPVVGIIS